MPQNKVLRNGQVPRPFNFTIEEWFDYCERWDSVTSVLKKQIRKHPEVGKMKIVTVNMRGGTTDEICNCDLNYLD